MWAATRSELVRLVQPRLLVGWFGLIAVFAALINVVMFSMTGGDAPPAAPGVTFPDAATLASPEGLVIEHVRDRHAVLLGDRHGD